MIPFLICADCQHFIGNGKCNAFPDEIPLEIIAGENDHSKPLEDQPNDLIFKSKTSYTFEVSEKAARKVFGKNPPFLNALLSKNKAK